MEKQITISSRSYLECDVLEAIIHQMILNLWENLDIPPAWGNSRLKTLWKGGIKIRPFKV